MSEITERLEYLRGELRGERISYDELHELANLARHIDPGDVELLEAAGVPEGQSPTALHQIVDFGPGPTDSTQGYPFEGSESQCWDWLREHGVQRPDGTFRYGVQAVPPDNG